jgi:polygalacturonase
MVRSDWIPLSDIVLALLAALGAIEMAAATPATPLQAAASDGRVVYNIRDFGAVAGGKTLCTAAIQKAVDCCADGGGGTVYFPPGDWLSGTIAMRSHVALEFESGSCLLGSTNGNDFPPWQPTFRSYSDTYVEQSLIRGENLNGVTIRGRGTIDGQWAQWPRVKKGNTDFLRKRPYVVRLVNCRDVLVAGVTLRNSPMWMQHYLACDRVRISGVTVYNCGWPCNDGMDIDGCRDVVITGCMIRSGDDAICLKSTSGRPCENVTIADCVLSSHCNALKMGSESLGGFRNITVTNCTVTSPLSPKNCGISGIALELADGGTLQGVVISNIVMRDVTTPIFIRLGNRGQPMAEGTPRPGVGTLRDVTISNVTATGAWNIGCSITGIPGHPVENVLLSNIRISLISGGTKADADRTVPEIESNYPDPNMFGTTPAYGLYCRHAVGLTLHEVCVRSAKSDERPALICDDVRDLALDGFNVPAGVTDAVRLIRSPDAVIRNCRTFAIPGN